MKQFLMVLLTFFTLFGNAQNNNGFSTISGTASYPSEGIPNDVNVYAKNISTNKIYKHSKFNRDTGTFIIKVPKGSYYVFSAFGDIQARESKLDKNKIIKVNSLIVKNIQAEDLANPNFVQVINEENKEQESNYKGVAEKIFAENNNYKDLNINQKIISDTWIQKLNNDKIYRIVKPEICEKYKKRIFDYDNESEQNPNAKYPLFIDFSKALNFDYNNDGIDDYVIKYAFDNCIGGQAYYRDFMFFTSNNGEVKPNVDLTNALKQKFYEFTIKKFKEEDRYCYKEDNKNYIHTDGLVINDIKNNIAYGRYALYSPNSANCCPEYSGDFTYNLNSNTIEFKNEFHESLTNIEETPKEVIRETKTEEPIIYTSCEKEAVYKGDIKQYLSEHISFPNIDVDKRIEKVILKAQTIIDENGKVLIGDIGTKFGVNGVYDSNDEKEFSNKYASAFENELIKVLLNMTNWTPAQCGGKNSKSKKVIPFTFQVSE